MPNLPDLEIGLQQSARDSFSLALRLTEATNEADQRYTSAIPIRIDEFALAELVGDPVAYGQELAQRLFADPAARSFFDQALAVAQSQNLPLRLRLAIGPDAPELHGLHWEMLHLPGSDSPLLAGETVRFSRYLASLDWRPVALRPEAALKALVVVANPSDLGSAYQMSAIDSELEVATARHGLGPIPSDVVAVRGQATLDNLTRHLRTGYDIFYLIAHGLLDNGEPMVFLEKEDGTTAIISGRELVQRIRELQQRPRLVVLASCQSAGTAGGHGALAGLGPRLAEAGIPAVIAMQDDVSMATIERFTPVFFEELRRDGQIDRAMAVARGAVRSQPDWWVPVLFMRLRSGRIGYRPGFGDERESLRKWPALINNVKAGRCTPVVGPGAGEWLVGSRRMIAERWAEAYGFPMAPTSRESLPQVAQYVAVAQDVSFMRDKLAEQVRHEVWQRFGQGLAPELETARLDTLISAAGRHHSAEHAGTPYRTLAQLPLPIYLTTNPDDMLGDALAAAGKTPVIELCRWNDDLAMVQSIYDREPDYRPTPQRPLVYHLFGRLTTPESVVLTEDDYFDFLIGVTSNNDLIPAVVRRALSDTALLFLGFNLDEWDFRVLFRSIMNREGRARRGKYAHIAAQIDPEQSQTLEPEGARRYLEEYFGDSDISIFWGNVDDFSAELAARWTAK